MGGLGFRTQDVGLAQGSKELPILVWWVHIIVMVYNIYPHLAVHG